MGDAGIGRALEGTGPYVVQPLGIAKKEKAQIRSDWECWKQRESWLSGGIFAGPGPSAGGSGLNGGRRWEGSGAWKQKRDSRVYLPTCKWDREGRQVYRRP